MCMAIYKSSMGNQWHPSPSCLPSIHKKKQTVSTIMEKQSKSVEESYELKQLLKVEKLCKDFDALADKPMADREDLGEVFKVLEVIRDKISSPPPPPSQDDGKKADKDDDKGLPESKRVELDNLLPLIEAALDKRTKPQEPAGADRESSAADSKSLSAAAASGCIPCVPRASQQQSKQQALEEQDKNGGGVVSLKLLLRLTKNVLEPELYYEWTTSYVDEERIYGWDKEADEVMESLVAPGDGERRMFRAAGIAGIHGSGKTALAQKVFVHDKAKDNFALRLWVCVGPPDWEDRFNLLYRMLDNLGLDTAKVEDIVDKSSVVREAARKEEEKVKDELQKEAAKMVAAGRRAGQNQAAVETVNKEAVPDDAHGSIVAGAGEEDANKAEEDRIYKELLKEKIDKSRAVERSKIGVLLYILHMSLSKTSYMIVFDDIRAYRRDDDGEGCWYSNLTLAPPAEGEWGDRLGYGLPKGKHRGAVLVTCRKEDDARTMVRTGLVVHPPKLQGDDAWKLFKREFGQAKEEQRNKDDKGKQGDKVEEDPLLKQLEEMKKEIVDKCLGLPVAIIEAARGFAGLEPLPDFGTLKEAAAEANKPAAAGGQTETIGSSKDIQQAETAAADAADKSGD